MFTVDNNSDMRSDSDKSKFKILFTRFNNIFHNYQLRIEHPSIKPGYLTIDASISGNILYTFDLDTDIVEGNNTK
jgi:hypothetical protein